MEIYAYLTNGTIAATISKEFIPEGVEYQTLQVPFYPIDFKLEGDRIVADLNKTLDFYRQKQINVIANGCHASIISGFQSDALGSLHTYPSNSNDQMNVNNLSSIGGNLWCQNSNGEWNFVEHTAVQVTKVQSDMVSYIQTQQKRYVDLIDAVKMSNTKEAIYSVTW